MQKQWLGKTLPGLTTLEGMWEGNMGMFTEISTKKSKERSLERQGYYLRYTAQKNKQ